MVVFVSHSCGFLSTWSVVSFTVERYVNVFHPLRRDTFCTKRRANVIVASLVSFALVVYAYTLFSYDTLRLGPAAVCAPRPGHHHIVTAMTAVDTFVACVVPSVFIVVLNARLIRKFRQYKVSQYKVSQFKVSQYKVSQYMISQNKVSLYKVSQYKVSQYKVSQYKVSQVKVSHYKVSQ